MNKAEMGARYSADLFIHLGLSDAPNVLGMLGNAVALPPALTPLVTASNLTNTLTGIPAILADVREIRGSQKNPMATSTDRAVDLAHFLGGDLLSTAGSLIPFAFPMSNPVAAGLYFATQAVGIGADLAKTAYDLHRQGQQSAWREGQEAVRQPSDTANPKFLLTHGGSSE